MEVRVYFWALGASNCEAKLCVVICHVKWAVTCMNAEFWEVVQGVGRFVSSLDVLFPPIFCPSFFHLVHLSLSFYLFFLISA